MKKFLLTFILLMLPCISMGGENPKNIEEYINKPYIGMQYEQALQEDLPFILMFANPNNVIYLPKYFSIGEMVYNEFKGQYNFCIINTKIKQNKYLTEGFNVKKQPAVFLINTQRQTFIKVDRKNFNKKDLREILIEFKNRTQKCPVH